MKISSFISFISIVPMMLSCREQKVDAQFTMTNDKIDGLKALIEKDSDFIEMLGTRDGGPYKQDMPIQGALGSTMRYGDLKFTVPSAHPGHYEFMPFVDKNGKAFALIYKMREPQR